jgi:hypothetical protein
VRLAPVNSAVSPRGYDIAARLARNGADAEGLIANCGLSRQEADLMVRLHGARVGDAASATGQRSARVEQMPARAQDLKKDLRDLRTPTSHESKQESRTSAHQTTQSRESREARATAQLPQVPVLRAPVASPDTRVAGNRRRGSLVSMVG